MFESPENLTASENRKVLVIDDEPSLRMGFQFSLQNETTTVLTASDGASGLRLLTEESFDAAFLDLRMPGMDGIEVIEKLYEAGNKTPVVLCSAFITLSNVLTALRRRVPDFLLKPVSPSELRNALHRLFEPPVSPVPCALAFLRAGKSQSAIEVLSGNDPAGNSIAGAWKLLIEAAHGIRPLKDAGVRDESAFLNRILRYAE